MNNSSERIMAIIAYLRKLPRWALILITVGVIIILGLAMFLLLPQSSPSSGDASYINSTRFAFDVFLKLGVVVLIIGVLAYIIKRMQVKGKTISAKQISVIETVHLSPHRTLYLVDIEGQKLLLGATDQSMSTLYELTNTDNSIEKSQNADNSQSFSNVLNQAQNKSED